MNKLQEVFIGWTIYRSAFHTDIIKMYSTILIRREHWVFQQYLWENSLDPAKQCQEKVIKTIIYGVCWSGNQAERKLRMTTEISRSRYPQIYEIISRGIYVDDCTSGSNSENEILNIADKLKMVLNSGGFSLKGLAFSSKDPPESWIPSRWWCQYSHSRNEMVHTRWFASIWFHRHEFQQKNKKKECASKRYTCNLDKVSLCLQSSRNIRSCWKTNSTYCIFGNQSAQIGEKKSPMGRCHSWQSESTVDIFEMMNKIKTLTFKREIVPDDAVNLESWS